MPRRTVLVVGATGILGPLAAALVASGAAVVGLSRTGSSGTVAVDATDAAALASALAPSRWDDAVVYAPAVSEPSLAWLRGATGGRLVLVRTSAAADPARGALVVPRDTVQLGWRRDGAGAGPWHSPEEVSDAAAAVLADGEPRVLGAVRPWSDRP